MQQIYQDFMMRDQERIMDKKNPSFEKMLKASKKKLDQYRKNLIKKSPRVSPRASPVRASSRQPVTVAKKLSMYFK